MEQGKTMEAPKPPSHIATKGLFNTAMGPLQRQLRSGEYNLFKCATMFESDFVQVSKRGGTLDVHNQVQMVRVAIAATSPGLQVPNVLLLARPIFPSRQQPQSLQAARLHRTSMNTRFELTRLLPLCFVKISIHDFDKQQLRFKMSTGRTFYLQLCPLPDTQESEFESWVKVVHLLRPPSDVSLKKEPVEDLWKPGQPALNATANPAPQLPAGREYTLAEVLSTLQEEEDKRNPAEPLTNQYSILEPRSSPSPTPSQGIPAESESLPPSEGPSSKELLQRSSKGEKKDRRHKDRSSGSRKSSRRKRSSKSRRSHSSKRAASRSPSKISSILMGSFSSTSHKHHKGSRKEGRERRH
ncbi:Golgi-associated RAB2 interactor protein 4-like [Podarcis raffonei]|uniref:Golgi-associated RAB2 interactor protein 4-like n=1 Tax=Podarcis raffonei TaxID=65483 RepID=UPI0023294392|nr:Golgi-associated RAB2 interactor protein 4-like [Podarcis raffonei]XP_053225136.1 Golgi-associated RAB2 interactor protein 4-like [Podarcis raffonei]